MRRCFVSACVLSTVLLPGPVLGQAGFPFQLSIQQGGSVSSVPNNASLTFNASAIGKAVTATVTVTYAGNTSALFSSPPQILGSTSFSSSFPGQLPLTLKPGDSFSFALQYTPASSRSVLAQLSIPYTEASASTLPPTSGTIAFSMTGVAPEYSVSYTLQTDGNVVPVPSGGSIQLQPTAVGASTSATIDILNRGSGPGLVTALSLTGSSSSLSVFP